MTKLSLLILLAGASNGITACFALFCCLSLVFSLFLFIYYLGGFGKPDHSTASLVLGIILGISCFCSGTISALIPSEKALYIAAGVETVNDFSKTETAKELSDDGMSIVKDITKIIHNYANESGRKD